MKLVGAGISLVLLVAVACGEEDKPNSSAGRGGAGGGGGSAGQNSSGKGGTDGDNGGQGGEAVIGASGAGGMAVSSAGAGAAGESGASGGAVGGEGGSAGSGPADGPVTGLVRSGLTPLEGVAVVVDGAVTSTDAAGAFSVADVDAEYQLILIWSEDNVVQVMDGMTTRSPLVQFSIGAATARSATIAGQVTGSVGIPDTAVYDNGVAFVSDSDRTLALSALAVGDDFYSMTADWGGEASQPGKLYALQVDRPALVPVGYSGFAEKALTISDAGAFGNTDGSIAATNLALIDPEERTLGGTVTLPDGYTTSLAWVNVGPFTVDVDVDAGAYSCVVPEGLGVATSLQLSTAGGGHSSSMRHAIPVTGDLDFVVPEAPTQVLPVAAATGVTTATAFSWTAAPAGTVVYVTFTIGGWTIWRFSTASSTTIPDLSAYGVALPAGASGSWSVTAEGPATTIEEVLAFEDRYWAADASLAEALITNAPNRSFTTAN